MPIRPISVLLILLQLSLLPDSLCLAANNSRPTPTAAQSYGQISDTIQKIEDSLNNGSHNLSDTEYQDFVSRVERLKVDAKIDISGGADASSLIGPANSLYGDLALRLGDNANLAALAKRQIDSEIAKLETLLGDRSANLSTEQHRALKQSISELTNRANGKLPYDGGAAALLHDVHQLYMEILSKSWTKLGSSKENKELPLGSDSTKNADTAAAPAKEIHRGHVEESAPLPPVTTPKIPLPRKPMISIPKQMELVENELITLHEKGQLGTFDMDLFTSKLLAIKKNWNVMIQKSGVLSHRQESTLRQELQHLNQSISDRINGLD
ncbi:MAG: hypothetical protein K2X77_13900 [Candidatus Obscuribacterales bacterium]|nr:hypothetical protein [Candidatus Obscuribacterales bacterium]